VPSFPRRLFPAHCSRLPFPSGFPSPRCTFHSLMPMHQQSASSDMSPSSRLLIEDRHQGTTSPAAARAIQRYAAFVAAQRAPVAYMHYAPFVKHSWLRRPLQPGQESNVALEKFDAASVNEHFGELDLSDALPASGIASSPPPATSSNEVTTDSRESRRASLVLGNAPLDTFKPYEELKAPGGEAWNVDIGDSEWIKTSGSEGGGSSSNAGSKRGSVIGGGSSKRGSLFGGVSRKASLNAGDSKLWSGSSSRRSSGIRGQSSGRGGFESSNAIVYNMLGTVDSRHIPGRIAGLEGIFSSNIHGGGKYDPTLESKDKDGGSKWGSEGKDVSASAAASAGAPAGETTKSASSIRRPSARGSFLRAHQAELKYGLPTLLNLSKSKRASMPPLHNRRGSGLLSTGAGARNVSSSASSSSSSSSINSRRGSLSVVHSAGGGGASRFSAARARSQSLPTDALFLAYSQCALPAVMTSSLASMPVPSQPAIPVSVARRYSVLLPSDGSGHAAHHGPGSSASSGDAPVASPSLLRTEQPVNVDPQSVVGIDTSSVLDTTQLHDLASPTMDEAESISLAAACPQPARRGSVSSAAAQHALLASASASRHSSPASSPVDAQEGSANLPHFFPLALDNAGTLNTSALNQSTASSSSASTGPGVGRSRSMINTRTSGIPVGTGVLAGANNDRAPLRIHASKASEISSGGGPLLPSEPDYTPMTSPTNLSHTSFRQTLMARRMSDVVARDIGKKLALLKKHMQQQQTDSDED